MDIQRDQSLEREVFHDGAEAALAELSSLNFVCVLQKLKAICTSAERE